MKPVSAEIVEEISKRLSIITPEAAGDLVELMRDEQPFVLVYLSAMGEGELSENEIELLVHIGIVTWQAMKQGNPDMPMVSAEDIDAAESRNLLMLEYFQDESGAGFYDGAEKLFKGYNQYEILKYIICALMEEREEDPGIGDDRIGIVFVYLKTVLDAMDR